MGSNERVAIVGLGAVFPGSGPDLDRFWSLVSEARCAAREVPADRWVLGPDRAFDPRIAAADHVYSTRACVLDAFTPDLDGLAIDPALVERLDPLFGLALHAANAAWRSARTDGLDRSRAGVILGNLVLPTDTTSALTLEHLGGALERVIGVELPGLSSGPVEPLNAQAAGLPAGLIARALGLGGGVATLDAACASSLYALKLAADELRSGRVDVMIAGGLSRPDAQFTQMGFAQLRALSARGIPSPFDARGDGLVVGEGVGLFVLKRLGDALRDGDAIHGVIVDAGLSNDVDGGLLAPSSEGQLRAMRQAYERAGWKPTDVDLIECHATGTPVGDSVEVASLRTLWGETGWRPGQCVIGSVKSNVGHALTAAGAAGLLKVLLALRERTLPPTAGFAGPGPQLEIDGGPFRVLSSAEPWPDREPGRPRRAAISGFGFGGINAHVLIEEWRPELRAEAAQAGPRSEPAVPVAIVGMGAAFGPWRDLREVQERVLGGREDALPRPPLRWWGASGEGSGAFAGHYIDEVELPADRFRIPPRELEEMLPQQSLMLRVAAEALADAGWDDRPRLRAGVLVGIGLDPCSTTFHLRWNVLARGPEWAERLGLPADQGLAWAEAVRDAAGPSLTANRTMGALGGLVASRVAREFRIGGPSFTLSSEETSGTKALEVALGLLARGELDQAVVGAVDLAGDPRLVLPAARLDGWGTDGETRPLDPAAEGPIPGEGAAVVVLKRLDDARRDGDRIYAVIRGIGAACGGATDRPGTNADAYLEAARRAYADAAIDPATVGYLEAHASGRPEDDRVEAEALAELRRGLSGSCALGSSKADLGHAGSASGLAGLVKAALCLHQQIFPPLRGGTTLRPELAGAGFLRPGGPQFWLRDRADGPRRAALSSIGRDGSCHHVVLEAYEGPAPDAVVVERLQPLGARSTALFAIESDDRSGLLAGLTLLEVLASRGSDRPVESLARDWFREAGRQPGRRLGLAMLADSASELLDRIGQARARVAAEVNSHRPRPDDRVYFDPEPLGPEAELAFVFPGSGNQFAGMGRALSAEWPEVLRAQDAQLDHLGSQLAPGTYWNGSPPRRFDDLRAPILGQVALGAFASDLLRGFGLRPSAVLGYSLGESAGLFALGAWPERDEMWRRIDRSPLFRTELAGPCDAARRAWGLADGEPVDWVLGVVPHPVEQVRESLRGRTRVYILIVNTPRETVIGGDRSGVMAAVAALGGRFFPVSAVSTVHCEVVREVEDDYRAMHLLRTVPVPGVRFYSGASGRAYRPDRDSAAEAILGHALHGFDFPALVRQAYDDGVRLFVEVGPGGSCSRMIARILGDRPHLAAPACVSGTDPVAGLLGLLGRLVAARGGVDLTALYGRPAPASQLRGRETPGRTIRVSVRGEAFRPPPLPPRPTTTARWSTAARPQPATPSLTAATSVAVAAEPAPNGSTHRHPGPDALAPSFPTPQPNLMPQTLPVPSASSIPTTRKPAPGSDPLTRQVLATETARAGAHEAYLRGSTGLSQTFANQLAFQMALIEALMAAPAGGGSAILPVATNGQVEAPPAVPARVGPPPALDRDQCLAFAVGTIGSVLGHEFDPVDAHPTRVRLPDEPLMLVDRILSIEGVPRSMGSGRVVTEHDIHPGAWYLDNGRIPTCIAVESGQADLFLSGYLGIDFVTKGLAVYRLLDAVVTFHRGLPGPGAVIHYDIHIDHFFRQGDTYLFRFRFEGTVDGQPLLSMRDGCAGFFTAEALAAGKGIVHTGLDRRPLPGKRPDDWRELAPMAVESLDAAQVEALRRGDLAAAFGAPFEGLELASPMRLPGGLMTLVDRVERIDPTGGRYGLGQIRAEADIRPDDWFMTCHFVDDRVMPGTLMFECCLHTLRILLMRMGWVGEHDEVGCEPIPGVASRLKCRGQVIESTQTVLYEVSIKELGYGPEPYAIADALMYADGKPIVEITDMSLRLVGLTRAAVERLWADRGPASPATALARRPAPLFDTDRILAFAIGNPSEAFGEPYRVFDRDRVIARLPGPPYQFLDRITAIDAQPWKMVAGGSVEAEYDVPADAWYFAADRQPRMPFAVLLEVALQPCGWLAAYLGSALTSETDLSFRNLGGSAVLHEPVTPATGTLTTRVTMTRVSQSGGMIIQHYDLDVRAGDRPIYSGDTYFGFFSKQALANQVGLRDLEPYRPGPGEESRSRPPFEMPRSAPFPDTMMRMVDRVDLFVPDGGPHGLGFVRGTMAVDPDAWFFKAHFHQDPVCPGSLGLEAFQQLLKVFAADRWGLPSSAVFDSMVPGRAHRWVYRGQVIPTDRVVTIEAAVTSIDDGRGVVTADGLLSVDGRRIYQMIGFTLGIAAEAR